MLGRGENHGDRRFRAAGELRRVAQYAKIKGMRLALALLACALAAPAAGIDGHWNAEVAHGKKTSDQPPAAFSLDLKTADGKVTGTVALAGKKRPQIQKIENGSLDGDHLTFTTSQNGKRPVTFSWEATLQGDQLIGTRTRDGGKRGQPFTAKRN